MSDTFEPFDEFEEEEVGGEAIIAAAQKASEKTANKKETPVKKTTAQKKKKPATKKKATAKKPAAPQAKTAKSLPTPGLVTRGVHGGLQAMDTVAGGGWWMLVWALLAVGAICLVVMAWWHRPADQRPTHRHFIGIPHAYSDLKKKIWNEFSDHGRLITDGRNEAILEKFATYLSQRREVESVERVYFEYEIKEDRRSSGSQQQSQIRCQPTVCVDITLRTPYLPVAWKRNRRDVILAVDKNGVILPPIMQVTEKGLPIIRNVKGAKDPALTEILKIWPSLRESLPLGTITDIDAHASLDRESQMGIVMTTSTGARILWGAVGEDKYGVDVNMRIAHLTRMLADQQGRGTIDVRFIDPYFVNK